MLAGTGEAVILHPCDAVSAERLVEAMADHIGICYLRGLRGPTPVLYEPGEEFHIGGSKVLRQSDHDQATVVAAGPTVHEALRAADELARAGIAVRVIDLYSIRPADRDTLLAAAYGTGALVTVEDDHPEGGLGEAVREAVRAHPVPLATLSARGGDGKAAGEAVSANAIIAQVQRLLAEVHV